MNIESLIYKIEVFNELVIDSGFKRDVIDYQQSINQAQNQNLIFMKEISSKVRDVLSFFENNSLDAELSSVLRNVEPFTKLETLYDLEIIDDDMEITAQEYFQKLSNTLVKLHQTISSNELELDSVREIFDKYSNKQDEYETDERQAVMSLVFKDLESTRSLKEFAKVINRWNRTLLIYHTLLKSESPKEVSLIEVQNGSIDVVFNIDFDVALDLTELLKTGLRVYGAYLLYKSKTAKEIITSYMGNKKLIASEKEREKLMLDNINESIKQKALEQHKENLKSDLAPSKTGATKKADEIAKVLTDHIVKGNEIKLLTPPESQSEDTPDLSSELRTETATVRERWKKLGDQEKQLLIERYTIREDSDQAD